MLSKGLTSVGPFFEILDLFREIFGTLKLQMLRFVLARGCHIILKRSLAMVKPTLPAS